MSFFLFPPLFLISIAARQCTPKEKGDTKMEKQEIVAAE
jgi:hypothetical protein